MKAQTHRDNIPWARTFTVGNRTSGGGITLTQPEKNMQGGTI